MLKKYFKLFWLLGAAFLASQSVYCALAQTEGPVRFSVTDAGRTGVDISAKFSTGIVKVDPKSALAALEMAAAFTTGQSRTAFIAGTNGVVVAEIVSDVTTFATGELDRNLALQQQLLDFIDLDIWQSLQSASDRASMVYEIEQNAVDLIAAAQIADQEIFSRGNLAAADVKRLEGETKAAESVFFASLQDFHTADADQAFTTFVDQKQELVSRHADFGRYKAIHKRFQTLLPAAEKKAQAIANNREALIAEVRVDGPTARVAGVVKPSLEE